jgi:hypothetical protein
MGNCTASDRWREVVALGEDDEHRLGRLLALGVAAAVEHGVGVDRRVEVGAAALFHHDHQLSHQADAADVFAELFVLGGQALHRLFGAAFEQVLALADQGLELGLGLAVAGFRRLARL